VLRGLCTAILSLEEQCYRSILLLAVPRRARDLPVIGPLVRHTGLKIGMQDAVLPESCTAIFSLEEESRPRLTLSN
jgi:hypothetical protein